jgi:DNA polymerase III epsilon subunit family exonuclease
LSLLSGARLAVVDIETTGFLREDAILEVACVHVDGEAMGGRWSSLVNPGRAIPAEAMAVHGITEAMVAEAPGAAGVAQTLRAACGDRPLVFHNAGFDLPFLARFLRAAGLPPLWGPVIDTLGLARGVLENVEEFSLGPLAGALGLPPEPPHRALGDALTTARLLLALAPRWEREKRPRSLADLAGTSQDVVRIARRRRMQERAAAAARERQAQQAQGAG